MPLDPIVMGLDLGRVAGAAGLDGVGIDRALPEQPVGVAEPEPGELLLLHGEEGVADDRPLALGIRHATQPREEVAAAIGDVDRLAAGLAHQVVDRVGIALAHEAGVDVEAEHAARAERPVAAVEGHRRVDAAADQEEHLAPSGLRPDLLHHLLDARAAGPSPSSSRRRRRRSCGRSRCRTRCGRPRGGTAGRRAGAAASAIAAIAAIVGLADDGEARRAAATTVSPWLIQTVRSLAGRPRNS